MRRKLILGASLVAGSVLALTPPAFAQDDGATPAEPLAESVQAVLDNIWVLVAAIPRLR